MKYRMKTNALMLTILMVLSTTLIIPSEEVEAAEVVITDAVRIVDGGPMNERMVSMVADSEGNIVAKNVINNEKNEIIIIYFKFISEGI